MRVLGVKRRLFPRAQHVESLVGLDEGAGVFRMQIEAIRTPIDLRGGLPTTRNFGGWTGRGTESTPVGILSVS